MFRRAPNVCLDGVKTISGWREGAERADLTGCVRVRTEEEEEEEEGVMDGAGLVLWSRMLEVVCGIPEGSTVGQQRERGDLSLISLPPPAIAPVFSFSSFFFYHFLSFCSSIVAPSAVAAAQSAPAPKHHSGRCLMLLRGGSAGTLPCSTETWTRAGAQHDLLFLIHLNLGASARQPPLLTLRSAPRPCNARPRRPRSQRSRLFRALRSAGTLRGAVTGHEPFGCGR